MPKQSVCPAGKGKERRPRVCTAVHRKLSSTSLRQQCGRRTDCLSGLADNFVHLGTRFGREFAKGESRWTNAHGILKNPCVQDTFLANDGVLCRKVLNLNNLAPKRCDNARKPTFFEAAAGHTGERDISRHTGSCIYPHAHVNYGRTFAMLGAK